MVYIAAAVMLLVQPVSAAMALMLVVALTGMGVPLYCTAGNTPGVGLVPLVVYQMVAPLSVSLIDIDWALV